MKYIFVTILLIFSFLSCSIPKTTQVLKQKGYNTNRDTICIKPYEFALITKDYYPKYEALHPDNPLNLDIGIKGYENADSIPIDILRKPFKFYIGDSSIKKILNGELRLQFRGATTIVNLSNRDIDSLKVSFNIKKAIKPKNILVLFFWNVDVLKDNVKYNIPAKKYFIVR